LNLCPTDKNYAGFLANYGTKTTILKIPVLKILRVNSIVAFILLSGVIIGLAILWQPRYPNWGEYHNYSKNQTPLPLSHKIGYRQIIQAEDRQISGVLLSLESPTPTTGEINVEIITAKKILGRGTAKFSSATSRGDLFVPIPPTKVDVGSSVELKITTVNTNEKTFLRYEIDSYKYKKGKLTRLFPLLGTEKEIKGTISFRIQYQQRAIASVNLHIIPLTIITLLLAVLQLFFWRNNTTTQKQPYIENWNKQDRHFLLIILIVVGGVFGSFWVASHNKVLEAGDTSKDILYIESARLALLNFRIPYWHHFTCGGQPLLGNIESNTESIAIPISLVFGSQSALRIALWLEVLFMGVGFYILGRLLGLNSLGSLYAGLLLPLSSFVSNRIFLGHTMFIGGMALAPWVLIGFWMGQKTLRMGIISSLTLSAMLGLGDTHILFYTLILLFVWSIIWSIQNRSLRPVLLLSLIISLFILLSFGKLLPSLEAPQHFRGTDLPKLVVPLISRGMLSNVFFGRSYPVAFIQPLHGAMEGWDNIGMYTGFLVVAIGIIGLIVCPRKIRWLLITPLAIFLIIGEGSFYESYLRNIPLVGSILRLPSRLFIVAIWMIVISGGFMISKLFNNKNRAIKIIAITLVFIAVLDLGIYSWNKIFSIERIPMQKVIEQQKPIYMATQGQVSPGMCSDFNSPPLFTQKIFGSVNISAIDSKGNKISTSLSPNEIRVTAPHTDIITVFTADSPLAQIENGIVLPEVGTKEGTITIAVTNQDKDVVVKYQNKTAHGAILISFCAWAGSLFFLFKRKSI
jgi:hypothetical protein